MSIDIDAARETFEAAQDGTVGIEEEFAILDPETLGLVSRFEQLRDAAADDPILVDKLAGELIAAEIEIRSGRGEDFEDARARQDDVRRRLFALAERESVLLGATATHPFSDYREQRIIDTPHYRKRQEGLQYVARRNNCFSLHVHVGIRGADRAVRVADRLRPVLPTLLAISANSPFLDGRDTGLHSARTQSFTKSFPRCGVPDVFGSWTAWAQYVALLVATGSIVEFTQLWWSVRPHHSFGTVEVRVCDAQTTKAESDALARLIVACVEQAARDVDEGRAFAGIPHRLIEENMWRATRYGLDGELLDLEGPHIELYPAATAVERLCAWAGVDVDLPGPNGAQRQRRMIAERATLREVYSHAVRETLESYHEEAIR